MSGAAAAADGASAAMEEAKLDAEFLRHVVQFAVRFVNFPSAGKHASVFVGVGVAEHDFLPASPGIEQGRVLGITPHAPHNGSGSAQGIDGFEQRHRHQAGIAFRSGDANACRFRQPDYREDVSF